MKLTKLIQLIHGTVLTDQDPTDNEVAGAMGADLMSDVLASIQPEAALLTGLCNPQVVRTAQIADIRAIILVRGKHPAKETIKLANEEQIPLITTTLGLFEACGILYDAGLKSLENETQDDCSD
jgi:predicted transcriptional regulator